jgi:two-component SAPR family response regulator
MSAAAAANTAAPWNITLLGGLSARHADRTITRFATQKTAALLAYLAFYRDRAHPREVLIALLWPDSDEKAARNRLSTRSPRCATSSSRPARPPAASCAPTASASA